MGQKTNTMSLYLDVVTSPTLILDPAICLRNLNRMKHKADRLGLRLVPHFKTPQSKVVASWARNIGINEITVSSVKMARYLSGLGFDTMHIAFPVNIREIDQLNEIGRSENLSLQIVNTEVAAFLATNLEKETGFFIEIDAGYGRTGVRENDYDTLDTLLEISDKSDMLHFRGFYIHPGHTYYSDIAKVYEQTLSALARLKAAYGSRYPALVTRVGDTPGCSIMENFGDVDEIGPGNFIFYDLMQVGIGSCTRDDIAICLAVPVVDINKDRHRVLIHGGGVHLSKDFMMTDQGKIFGEAVLLNEKGWSIPDTKWPVVSISQEHGIVQVDDEFLASIKVGDLIGILPVHSCMTADCMKQYLTPGVEWIDHAEG